MSYHCSHRYIFATTGKVEPREEEVQQDQERATSVQDLAHSPPWWATRCVNRECHHDQTAILQV